MPRAWVLTGWLVLAPCLATADEQASAAPADRGKPHIVLIMADDLGYGDVSPLNSQSQIATPAFDRLAAEGITFTDAHTPSAVCTPTRYGLLTGRYCWRSRLKRGVQNGYGPPLIEADRPTLGTLLGRAGYRTAVVGKWHLGLGLVGEDDTLDLRQPLTHHPGTVGFQHSLIIPASLDFPPYVYFRDGQATSTETVTQSARPFPGFTRKGPRAEDFEMRGCLDRLTDEAVTVIESIPGQERPTFLYFPLTAPHKPVLPTEEFLGTSGLGPYGDFVRQVDACLGRTLEAIDRTGISDETLVIVTSDNGSFMHRLDDADASDHVDDASIQAYRPEHHRANGPWRGTKADIWEAGHRVPFFVRLPGGTNAGGTCSAVVGLIDIYATLAEWTGTSPVADAAPDSHSFLPLLDDPTATFRRPPLVCHSVAGMFALRDAHWKLVAGNGSGGREKPRGKPFERPYQLFDLSIDPGEQNNLITNYPEVAKEMEATLTQIREPQGRP